MNDKFEELEEKVAQLLNRYGELKKELLLKEEENSNLKKSLKEMEKEREIARMRIQKIITKLEEMGIED
ncbi:MAG: hypothetical protein JRI44_00490 [Deltaproteobacteria bacterium]|nr:hypothetical protein [Deltaproteobacteria bacterium]